MTRIGNRALADLGALLNLESTEGLSRIDLDQLIPVMEVSTLMQEGLGIAMRFVTTVAATAAGNPNQTGQGLTNAANFTEIFSDKVPGLGLPAGMGQRYITAAGLHVATPANFTNAYLCFEDAAGTQSILVASWSSLLDDKGVTVMPTPRADVSGGDGSGFRPVFYANVTGNTDVTLTFDLLAGPPGLLPRL